MRRLLMRAVSLLGLAVLLGTGCAAAPEPTHEETPAASPTPDLEELRIQYGLPDCPDTDPNAEPVADGLPRTDLQCLGSDKRVNLAGLPREPMVINFWAQWCGPCREEAPYLRTVSADSDATFVGINYSDPLPDWAIEFAGLVEWFYPHVQDPDQTLQSPLKIPGLPSTLFVTADGRVAGLHPGQIHSEAELRELMERYLGRS